MELSEHWPNGPIDSQNESFVQNRQVFRLSLIVLECTVELQLHLHGHAIVLVWVAPAERDLLGRLLLNLPNLSLVASRYHFSSPFNNIVV